MPEEKLADAAEDVYMKILFARSKRHMKQIELARLIGEDESQVSRAVHGNMTPKSIAIRQKIYKKLDIKGDE